jgi:hypothetical protein
MITIQQAANQYFSIHGLPNCPDEEKVTPLELREWMLYLMADTRRFRNMKLCNHLQILDEIQVKQFSSLTILVSRKHAYLSYRGTGDDLIGWKEDFLLACLPEIPAQEEAVFYLQDVADQFPERFLMVGGHSKGGNLAVYAAVQAPESIQDRICAVWSNDGPGFTDEFVHSDAFHRIEHKIHFIVPKSSVVGLLLAHAENYQIVDSSQIGLLQHDGLSWQVMADHFVTLSELTKESIRTEQKIRTWLQKIPLEERRKFVDSLFDVLQSTGAHTVSEIKKDRAKTAAASIPAMKELPKDTRERILEFLMLLNTISRKFNDESKAMQENKRPLQRFTRKSMLRRP